MAVSPPLPRLSTPARAFTLAATTAPDAGVDAAIFGAPLDATGSWRPGTAGGPAAVRQMSDSLETWSPALERDLEDCSLVDLGDVEVDGVDVVAAVDAVAAAMERAISLGRLGVMIGGEHTVSLGGFRAIRRVHPDAALLQLDAHADLRDEWDGSAVTHASWLYHAGSEHGFDRIVQLGVRSGSRDEWRRAQELPAWSGRSLELSAEAREVLEGRPVYLTIDIDVLDPAAAPGVGCPEPGGPSFAELEEFLHSLAGLEIVAVDVVEVAPAYDPADVTAAAAAKLVREAILSFGVPR